MKDTKMKPKLPTLHRLIREMSSENYHSVEGAWSSSQLKDIIDDEAVFIQKYVKKEIPRVESEAFDTGTYFHTACLEPWKVAREIAVFDGKVRHGKQWENFKTKNLGKTIISQKQKEVGDSMIRAVKSSPISMQYIKGDPEISLFVELLVSGGRIFAPYFSKVLTPFGWESVKKVPDKGFKIVVKVRADCLGETFISDLKSTSGSSTKPESVRGSISRYKYDLSAALYLDMFSLVDDSLEDFIWIFASKESPISVAWRASQKQKLVGRAKWSWAVKRLADLSAANWEIADYLRDAEPLPYELEWLTEKDSDLL